MEQLFFEEIFGKQIFCILSQPKVDSKKIVIMSHGFRGSSVGASRSFVDFKDILVSEGFTVLRFDQPNSGNSEGKFIDSSFDEWVKSIVYFSNKYLSEGYEVILLGQSMGATASVIASNSKELMKEISSMLLWVPDPKSDVSDWVPEYQLPKRYQENIIEEAGQKYKESFWQEVKDADFFASLNKFKGSIHLVYGEKDLFVSEELRKKVINAVKNKGQQVMILKGQNHIGWEHNVCQMVYKTELEFLEENCC